MARKLIRVVLLFSVVLLFGGDASALGSYHLRSTEVDESGGQWHLYVAIDLPSPPPIPHMPMKFMFTELTQYERALTDNSKDPVLNRIPLQNQLPHTESLDVDFANAQGKIWKSTRYDFSLTRARGYEAGEYKFQLRTTDGSDVGSSTTVILKGDNPVVDRRSITFSAGAKKDKDKKDAGVEVADNAGPATTEVAAVGTPPPFVSPDSFKKTPEEEQVHTQGGGCCGGSMIASTAPTSNAAIVALTVGLGVLIRRRRTDRKR
jgi:hypothetical protein